MRQRVLVLLSAVALSAPALRADDCQKDAATQTAMNACGATDLKHVEAALSDTLARIRTQYADDPLFLERLEQSQLQWRQSLQADLDLRFPQSDTHFYYGSVFPLCLATVKTGLIQHRIAMLNVWLTGLEEGEVCAGSVHIRPSADE